MFNCAFMYKYSKIWSCVVQSIVNNLFDHNFSASFYFIKNQMEIIIFDLIGGFISQVITWLSIKTKLSQTAVSIILPIIFWIWYYFVDRYWIQTHSIQRQQIVWIVSGCYASSQLFYNYFKTKWRIPEKK